MRLGRGTNVQGRDYDLSRVRHVWVLRKVGDRLLLASARVIVVVL